jgi:flagellar operon protein (TIGR03826 family)
MVVRNWEENVMGFNQLDNCPKCGKLFVKGVRDVCSSCYTLEEEEYRIVSGYLRDRENRKATIYDASEDTGVSIKLITKFIRQGRISLEGLPNMGFPCESCGQLIAKGTMCAACRGKLESDVKQLIGQEQKRQDEERYKPKDAGYRQIKDK